MSHNLLNYMQFSNKIDTFLVAGKDIGYPWKLNFNIKSKQKDVKW